METGRWRGLNLFLALVIAAAAAGGSLLLVIGQHDFGQDAPPFQPRRLDQSIQRHCQPRCRPRCRPRSANRRSLRNSRPDLLKSLSNPGPSRSSRITPLQVIPIRRLRRREAPNCRGPHRRNKVSTIRPAQRQPPRRGRMSQPGRMSARRRRRSMTQARRPVRRPHEHRRRRMKPKQIDLFCGSTIHSGQRSRERMRELLRRGSVQISRASTLWHWPKYRGLP